MESLIIFIQGELKLTHCKVNKILHESNLLILLFACSSFTIHAQAPDTLVAHNLYEKAMKFYRQLKNYDSARLYFDQACAEYEKFGDVVKVSSCILRSGNCSFNSGNYKLAMDKYENAKTYTAGKDIDPKILSDIYNNLGAVYERTGKRYLAKLNLEEGLKIRLAHFGPGHKGTGLSYANLGTSYLYFGEYRKGLDFYLKAIPIYVENYGEEHYRLAGLYVNIGIAYDKMGDHTRAIDYYLKANEIDKKNYGESYAYTAYNYHNLGISYDNLGKDSLALANFKRTIALSRANNQHELHATAIYQIGNNHRNNRQFKKALQSYEQAIKIITDNFDSDHPRLNYYYGAIAGIKQQNKNYAEAEKYLNKAIGIVKKNYGARHTDVAKNLKLLANLYREQGKYDKGLLAANEALSIVLSGQKLDFNAEISFKEVLDHHRFLDILEERSELLISRYDYQSKEVEDLKYALSHFQTGGQVLDHIRRGYITESSKIFLQNRATFLYDKAIGLCLKLYSITREDNYLAQALAFSEKNKATVLAEALQAADLTSLQGIPDSVLSAEKSLKERILLAENNYLEASQQTSSQKEIGKQKDGLFQLKRSYDSLVQKISQNYPDYYDLKYDLNIIGLEETKNWLDNHTAVLSYFIGHENIYVFAITKKSIDVKTVTRKDFDPGNLQAFRTALSNEKAPYREFAGLAYDIYHHLVEIPLATGKNLNRLIVIPDGVLNYIPFEALVTAKTDNGTVIPDYLIKTYTVSYANSLSLLINQQDEFQPIQVNYIGFAPSYSGNGSASSREASPEGVLLRLGGALEEVKLASKMLRGEIFLDKDASEYNFKNISGRPAILHLAMHATVDDKDPMRSKLLFTSTADSVEDGNLNAYEIYNLKLSSQLAVLSACNTGFGEIKRGEGIMSLSRAFRYAGCPNIVMSLWKAKDQPSSKIISELFRNLKMKMPKDEALRQAKLSYLASGDPLQAHPANWATLVLLGNTQPLIFVPTQSWLLIGIFLIIMAVLFFIIARKYYSRRPR